jgi:hypothetical protein
MEEALVRGEDHGQGHGLEPRHPVSIASTLSGGKQKSRPVESERDLTVRLFGEE